jgi:glycosyltransferase involved in cell wall biosynthesis
LRQDGTETGWLKRATSRWFYATLLKVGSVELRPGAADYRLLSRRVIDVFCKQVRERNPFLRGLVGWVGYPIVYLPFVPERRAGGRSKYRPSTLINFALNGIFSFSKAPLRLCIGAGLIIALLSFIAGILEIFIYLLGDVTVPGWASLFAIVSLVGGIQLFFLGILGEYVGLIFDEVKGRPIYLLDRLYGRANGQPEMLCDSNAAPDAAARPQYSPPDSARP